MIAAPIIVGSLSAGTTRGTLGEMVFSNSNGVSFGVNGQTITASHNGLTNQSNPAFSAGGGSSTFQTLSFSNANGISFSNNAGQVQASYTVPSQTVQPGIQSIQVSNTTYTTGNVIFSNANGASFGSSAGGGVTLSYTVPTVTNSSWSVSDAATSGTVAHLAFTNLNGVTLSLSTGAVGSHTIVGSHNGLTSQSNQNVTAGNGGFAFQTLSFSNVNGISFGTSADSAITASHNGITSQSNQNMSLFALGNTTQNSSTVLNASNLSFNFLGIATGGYSNGSVQISVPAGAPSPVNFSAGTTSNNLGSVIFSNSNNNTFGLNGSTITASAPVNFSAGTTSNNLTNVVFSNSNGVSFGLNGSTVTASVAAGVGVTLSGYAPYDEGVQVAGQQGQGTLHIQPLQPPSFQHDRIGLSVNYSNASNSTGSITISVWVGMYTQNLSTLSLSQSTSTTIGITFSGTVGNNSLQAGPRMITIPWTSTWGGSNYWIAVGTRTTSGGANASFSQFLVSDMNSNFSGIFGLASNASRQRRLGLGVYSASTSSMPNSIAFSQILGSASLAIRQPNVNFLSETV